MPNLFSPIGYALSDPYAGGDIIAQFLRGYMDPQGVGGTGGRGSYAGASGPVGRDLVSRSLLLGALSSGQPVSEVQRTPQMGLIPYGLSKLGLISPTIRARPDEMQMEQLALQQKREEDAANLGNVFESAAKVAATSPELAEQFWNSVAPNIPGAQQIPPNVWKGIYTRQNIQLLAEQERERYDRAMEQYHTEMERISQQRADTAEKAADARSAQEVASMNAIGSRLDMQQKNLDERMRADDLKAQQEFVSNLLKLHADNPTDPYINQVITKALRVQAGSTKGMAGVAPPLAPPSAGSGGGGWLDRLFPKAGSSASASTAKPLPLP